MLLPPTITTERLILKALTETDEPSYRKHFVDYEVVRHLTAKVPWPYPDDGVKTYLKRVLPKQGQDKWVWGIFLKERPEELIGLVDLWRPGSPENRGFWLGRKYWNRGIMSEAVTPVMDFAFDVLNIPILVFSNAKGNIRSRRIKEKTGARLVRVVPGTFVDPEYTESEIWELTREEWRARGEG